MAKLRINGKDFFWKHADVLYASGVNPSGYDERIIPFIALKLLVDYGKVRFNFDYRKNFGLSEVEFSRIKGKNLRETFLNLVLNLEKFSNFKFMEQEKKYNDPKSNSDEKENAIRYFVKAFNLDSHLIKELHDDYLLEAILDVYNEVNFREIGKEKFKDLYETTIARMRKGKQKGFNGVFMGQHFTQSAIVKLICETAYSKMRNKERLTIYDPACGVGMMLIESYFFFKEKGIKNIEVYGQEIDLRVWLLAKIFMEVLDVPNKIARGNTLTNPAFINEGFDLIIANPPFGVDWKHEEPLIRENLKDEEKAFFFVVKDEKGEVVLPPRNDGQFLFMLHVIKLMLNEKQKGKEAFAGIISSSSLPSISGKSQDLIRKRIFELGIVDTILLQPPNMFSNTGVQTCIWFLDTQKMDKENKYHLTLIRADNPELYSEHPDPIDEMKNTYSEENIREIVRLINSKDKEVQGKKKVISVQNTSKVDVSSLIPLEKDDYEDVDLYELYTELRNLMDCLCKKRKNENQDQEEPLPPFLMR